MKLQKDWSHIGWMAIIILLGIGLRLFTASRGHNYDFDSYLLVVDILKGDGNVYAETTRYNYGPIWFMILSLFNLIASLFPSIQHVAFRYILIGFLSLVDAAIFNILWKKAGKMAACLFFFNPISIIITGYHNQFDNLALLLGFLAVALYGDHYDSKLGLQKILGLIVLGLSLATKHILFLFPFWIAVKQKGLLQKELTLLIPLLLFFAGFIPFLNDGYQGIIQNVFMYKSWYNRPFFQLFVPGILMPFISAQFIWLLLLGFFGIVFKSKTGFDSLLLYSCILVAASPAITNQYLAIVIPFISVNSNFFFIAYSLMGTWNLLVHKEALHIAPLQSITNISQDSFYFTLVALLCFGLTWHLWRKEFLVMAKKMAVEVIARLDYRS